MRQAHIFADGSLGTWQATTPLPVALDGHVAVVYNSWIYVIGGYQQRSVFMAPVRADGSLGAWQALSRLPVLARPVRWS
ncbi:MAG: hypothetical protein IPO15_24380 [Anaerolineae bacterium]|uniref:hypothetical protein n=1 Tax=Candidatus Amarolinea dominans TaxID=3140696 RepID=UPI00313641D6|nr:hypothetical protein [Anaerolineae bacterium]